MPERDARRSEAAPALGLGSCLWADHLIEGGARRGTPVARPWGVGRGEPILLREHARSAPRGITVPNELTKGCWRRGTPMRGRGVVGRGKPQLVREHPSSAPHAITVPNEFTKACLWSGSAPPNGSRLSCGA